MPSGTELAVTDFKLTDDKNEGVSIKSLLDAINKYCGKLAEEYDFSLSPTLKYDAPKGIKIPTKYGQLIAYATEGSNEGYYVHVGALIPADRNSTQPAFTIPYMDFGFAKTNSAESAYELAKQAQRFLTAARWN
jgi:hypothetical protein